MIIFRLTNVDVCTIHSITMHWLVTGLTDTER
jgi:hypothetical protein